MNIPRSKACQSPEARVFCKEPPAEYFRCQASPMAEMAKNLPATWGT